MPSVLMTLIETILKCIILLEREYKTRNVKYCIKDSDYTLKNYLQDIIPSPILDSSITVLCYFRGLSINFQSYFYPPYWADICCPNDLKKLKLSKRH